MLARIGQTTFGIATEIAWIGAHLAMYPIGLVSRPLDARVATPGGPHGLAGLTALQRGPIHTAAGPDTATIPIVLIHGIGDNHTIFATLTTELTRRGFTSLWTFDYGLFTADVRQTARTLATVVEELARRTGHLTVHVIGHSLGGLIARYYIQRMGGGTGTTPRIDTLITLGTPHQGTDAARLAGAWGKAWPLVRQLRPDSDLISELAEPAPEVTTRFVAFHSDLDHLIVPQWRGRIDHPDLDHVNIAVHRVGHMSLTNNRTVAHRIAGILTSPESLPAQNPYQ